MRIIRLYPNLEPRFVNPLAHHLTGHVVWRRYLQTLGVSDVLWLALRLLLILKIAGWWVSSEGLSHTSFEPIIRVLSTSVSGGCACNWNSLFAWNLAIRRLLLRPILRVLFAWIELSKCLVLVHLVCKLIITLKLNLTLMLKDFATFKGVCDALFFASF